MDSKSDKTPPIATDLIGTFFYAVCFNGAMCALAAAVWKATGNVLCAVGVVGFFLGAAIGGWINLFAWRIYAGVPLWGPESLCDGCRRPLSRWHKTPLIGWCLARGRCANCGRRVSPIYVVVEFMVGVLGAGVAIAAWRWMA